MIRRQTIPLPDHKIEQNRIRFEADLKKNPSKSGTWETRQKLSALSEKAGRLAARQITTQLAGVSSWLQQLQSPEHGQLQIVGDDVHRLRKRLDVPEGTPWNRRIDPLNTKDWTADFLFKLAILRNAPTVTADILDWAMHLTWLTMTKGEIPGATVPFDLFVYCACAVVFCKPFKPIDAIGHLDHQILQRYQIEVDQPKWQFQTLHNLISYRQRPATLLTQSDYDKLDHMVKNEPQMIFLTAKEVSRQLREQFREWGLKHA